MVEDEIKGCDDKDGSCLREERRDH